MEDLLEKYIATLEKLTVLQSRLDVLHENLRSNKFITVKTVCAIFDWEVPEDQEEE